MKVAIEFLAFFINFTDTDAIDDDKFDDFTHNGGWQKIDKVLPLMYPANETGSSERYSGWLASLDIFTGRLEVSSHRPHILPHIEEPPDIRFAAFRAQGLTLLRL